MAVTEKYLDHKMLQVISGVIAMSSDSATPLQPVLTADKVIRPSFNIHATFIDGFIQSSTHRLPRDNQRDRQHTQLKSTGGNRV